MVELYKKDSQVTIKKAPPKGEAFHFDDNALRQFGLQVGIQFLEEFFGIEVMFTVFHIVAVNTYRQIFGHITSFYGFDTHGFERLTETNKFLIVI